jgi:kumamolisin
MKCGLIGLLLITSVVLMVAGPVEAGTRRGSAANAAVGMSRTPSSAPVFLMLRLQLPGAAALHEYVVAQRAASSPTWLTPPEIGQRYGVSDDDLDAVVRSLTANQVHVTHIFSQRTALLAEGDARDVEHLFGVRLHQYRDSHGALIRVPSAPPTIPAALRPAVTSVSGLDTTPAYRPASRQPRTASANRPWWTPTELRGAFGANALVSQGATGQGEVVAVASLATMHGAETKTWAKSLETSRTPDATITVAPAPPGAKSSKWVADSASEVALDLEMVRAVAPDATILNYQTQNMGDSLERIVDQVVDDHRASIVTISWGSCEAESDLQRGEAAYESAEAAGVTVLAASGDHGPYGCFSADDSTPDMRISVDYPAASAHVLAVGGVTLSYEGEQVSEQAWQDPQSTWGSGGGASTSISRPPWQSPAVVHQRGSTRIVPDIAGPADESLNLITTAWDEKKSQVSYYVASGTSAAAPFWAGVLAITKQYVRAHGANADVSVAPLLYSIAADPSAYKAAFFDDTTGGSSLYPAGKGWDFVTGLGTPHASGLAQQWVARASGGG